MLYSIIHTHTYIYIYIYSAYTYIYIRIHIHIFCVMDIGKYTFNSGFASASMTLRYERKSILEVLAPFSYMSQKTLQRLRLLAQSDVKSKLLAYS